MNTTLSDKNGELAAREAQICANVRTDLSQGILEMATSPRFTITDICAALAVKKHDVRAWLRLPPYCEKAVRARSARKFTQTELVFFALVAQMHMELGLSPRALARCSATLYELLLSRLEAHRVIAIDIQLGSAAYLELAPTTSGVVIAVAPAIERIQRYLLGELPPVGMADGNVLRLERRIKA